MAFIITYIKTGSLMTTITIAGIGVAWFLLEFLFDLPFLFGQKSDDKINDDVYKKDKENLEKTTENNPTLR